MLTVTTLLWHDEHRRRDYEFTHDHVRTLRNMIARNLTLPHKFVCVSDDEIDDIETVPLDWTKHVPGTCFIRLMLRKPDIDEILGPRIFCVDLDVVVVGNLDEIAGRTEDNVLWHNPNYPAPRRAFFQTSVQLLDAGSRPELWADFDPEETPKWCLRRFGGSEQSWFSERLSWTEPFWDGSHGIFGAGRMFRDQMDKGIQTVLPENARIVSFPGNRMPDQPEVRKMHPWISEFYR